MTKRINPKLKLKPRSLRSLDQYLNGLAEGDRFILGEVLTLVESNLKEHREIGEQILNTINNESANTLRIGVTGSPGAGKSTFIETLGNHFVAQGNKVAVLAIDPSSTKSQGSILGDKTRMQSLSTNKNAFVRPTASANRLGGVAQSTKESIALCEAAGYNIILVESVGVGQSETELADLVDVYLLLLLPGGGDSVQGIKRGIVELADIMVVNKYDGDYKHLAEKSRKDFALSSALFHHDLSGWRVPVSLCSSTENVGFDKVIDHIESFKNLSKDESYFATKRSTQNDKWLSQQINKLLIHKARQLFVTDTHLQEMMTDGSVFKTLKRIQDKVEEEFTSYLKKKHNEHS